ncbi:MAG: VOC family protein [Pseudomonadota bacterium]
MNTLAMTPPSVPKTAAERGKIAPAKFAHIVMRTSRFEEMVTWYKTVLEAETVMGSPMIVFLSFDEEHHRLAIMNQPGLGDRSPQANGVDHWAYTYASLDDLFATYERLRDLDILPYWTINHGGTLSMYYRDPDGNQIELQIDSFDSNEETTKWLTESDFAVNPIGVKFDPEELIARYRSGEDKASVLDRPVISPSEIMAQLPTP